MDGLEDAGRQMFRLWIATYDDWRPSRWNEAPPRAVALEPVEESLYSAAEAALFLEGFNSSMLECDKPIWAVAVPVAIRLEGDAVCGMPVKGHVFSTEEISSASAGAGSDGDLPAARGGGPVGCFRPDHFQGLDQSPQRSR